MGRADGWGWLRVQTVGRRWGYLGAAAILLFGVGGCASGTVASNPISARPGTTAMTPAPSDPDMPSDPLPRHAVVIGLPDNGKTVTIWTGQHLAVTLAANWTPPQAQTADNSVTAGLQPLRTDSAQGYPAAVAGTATFTALRAGTAVITAHTDLACLHTTPRCLRPQQSFAVTVRVLPPPGTGAGPLPKQADR